MSNQKLHGISWQLRQRPRLVGLLPQDAARDSGGQRSRPRASRELPGRIEGCRRGIDIGARQGKFGGQVCFFFWEEEYKHIHTHIYTHIYIYNIWRCFMISTSFQLGNVHKFYIYGIHDKNRRLQGHRIVHGKMTQPTNNLEMWRVDFIRHRIGTWTPKNWPHLFIIREVHDVKNRGVPKIGFPTCLMKIPPDREGVKRIESIQNCSNPPIM